MRTLALHTAYWATVTFTAALVSLAAAIPFTGTAASTVGTFAAAGVCMVGIALAPTPRKARP
ncbi:MAG TPA: hypothetical protein VI172_05770 [Candidatus Dormibacteraeota bacterium]